MFFMKWPRGKRSVVAMQCPYGSKTLFAYLNNISRIGLAGPLLIVLVLFPP